MFADELVVIICDVSWDNSTCCSLSHASYGYSLSCLLLTFMLCNVVLFVFDSMYGDVFFLSFA